jgi:hypothetical protein
MVGRCACGGVDTHADQSSRQNVPGEAGRTRGRDVLGQLNDLRIVTFLLDRNRDVGVALGDDSARRGIPRAPR